MPLATTKPTKVVPKALEEFLSGAKKGVFPEETKLERAYRKFEEAGVPKERLAQILLGFRSEAKKANRADIVTQIDILLKPSTARRVGEFVGEVAPYIPAFGITGKVTKTILPTISPLIREMITGAAAFPLARTYSEVVEKKRLPTVGQYAGEVVFGAAAPPIAKVAVKGTKGLIKRVFGKKPVLPYKKMTGEEIQKAKEHLAEVPKVPKARKYKNAEEFILDFPDKEEFFLSRNLKWESSLKGFEDLAGQDKKFAKYGNWFIEDNPIYAKSPSGARQRYHIHNTKGEVVAAETTIPRAMAKIERWGGITKPQLINFYNKTVKGAKPVLHITKLLEWQKSELTPPLFTTPELNALAERLKKMPLESERRPLWYRKVDYL